MLLNISANEDGLGIKRDYGNVWTTEEIVAIVEDIIYNC